MAYQRKRRTRNRQHSQFQQAVIKISSIYILHTHVVCVCVCGIDREWTLAQIRPLWSHFVIYLGKLARTRTYAHLVRVPTLQSAQSQLSINVSLAIGTGSRFCACRVPAYASVRRRRRRHWGASAHLRWQGNRSEHLVRCYSSVSQSKCVS